MRPPGGSLSQHLYVLSSLEALWTASFWTFMENSFIDITDYIIGHRQLIYSSSPLLSPEVRDWKWKSQPCNHMIFPWAISSPEYELSKSHFIQIKKDIFIILNICSSNLGKFSGLGSCESGTLYKHQIYMRNVIWSSEWPNVYFLKITVLPTWSIRKK